MQLQLVALFAALSTVVSADTITVRNTGPNGRKGLWVNSSGGRFNFDANPGCRNPRTVPYVYEVCMDYTKNPNRGHFWAQGQQRRCFQEVPGSRGNKPCGAPGFYCDTFDMAETPCIWRIEGTVEDDGLDARSVEAPATRGTAFTA